MATEFTTSYLQDVTALLHYYKRIGERALEQIRDDAELLVVLDDESNSIATIIKHLSGNMRSRWTNFLTTDGEKPDRNRDGEFEAPAKTRAEIMAVWELGWRHAFDGLAALSDADLARTVYIRKEPLSVTQAINRQITHCSYHIGQIVFLAKHFSSGHWNALTTPRRKSSVTAGADSGSASPR